MQLRGVAYLGARVDMAYDAATLTVVVQAAQDREEADLAPLSPALRQQYAPPCAFARGLSCGTTPPRADPGAAVFPSRERLSVRSQVGRVVLRGGAVVAQQALVLVDASGARHTLVPGVAVSLPTQSVAIMASGA